MRSIERCRHKNDSISRSILQRVTARASVKLHDDLREFVALLLSRGVEFVVVGGHAVAFHGYPRMTDDVDLLVRPTEENGQRIVGALQEFGFGAIGLTADDFTAPDRVIQLGRVPNRVDLLTQIYGVTFDEVWATRVQADLDGLNVAMIGREPLIRNKRATGRAQDLADAAKLETAE
jgi:predicted nucleotidyltransferase